MSHRKPNRGCISMHQVDQHIVPSILFPVQRSIQPHSTLNAHFLHISRYIVTWAHSFVNKNTYMGQKEGSIANKQL